MGRPSYLSLLRLLELEESDLAHAAVAGRHADRVAAAWSLRRLPVLDELPTSRVVPQRGGAGRGQFDRVLQSGRGPAGGLGHRELVDHSGVRQLPRTGEDLEL